ncbi:NAD-dependent epimerase/dehydratase family protein [bacterium]|nr:NAD-dependent epimerase/dehydratase family protein [bacterium]
MNRKKILVTGGAGFIGSNIAKECERLGADVVVVDDFRYGDFRNLRGFLGEIIPLDIREILWLEFLRGFDTVFHQAAITDTRVNDQKLMMEVNTSVSIAIIESAIKHGIKVVYASSAAVYGNLPAPQSEDGPTDPLNIYGFSKLKLDDYVLRLRHERGDDLPVIGLRYFNVHGPGERYKGEFASMVFQLTEQALKSGRIKLFKHGEQYRDHLHVKNVVDASIRAVEYPKCDVFNVGLGIAASFNQIVEAIEQALNRKFKVEWIDNPWPFYQDHTHADISKAKELLGYEPDSDPIGPMVEYIRGIADEKW